MLWTIAAVLVCVLLIAAVLVKVYIKLTTGWDYSYTCLAGKTIIVTGANSGCCFFFLVIIKLTFNNEGFLLRYRLCFGQRICEERRQSYNGMQKHRQGERGT